MPPVAGHLGGEEHAGALLSVFPGERFALANGAGVSPFDAKCLREDVVYLGQP